MILSAVGIVVAYFYKPGLIVSYSPFPTLAYHAFLRADGSAEWKVRMQRKSTIDYNWLIETMQLKGDERPRFISAWSLGIMGKKEAIPYLILSLENDSNFQVRYTCARALGALDARVAISNLIKAINDGDTAVRNIVIDVLGDMGAKEAIPDIQNAKMKYQYPSMEYSADEALRKLK